MCHQLPFLYGKWHRFLRFLLFLNEQVERHGKMTSMIKIDLEPQSSAQMEPIHSVRAGIFSAGCVTPTICASFQILDDWDAQSAKIGWFDELWWIVMNCDELWWIMMNYDELWWIMMNYDELWWIMMNYDELWWIMMNYDELWWIIWLESGPKLVPMAIHQRSSLQRLSRSRICSSLRESSQYFSNKR